MLVIPQQLEDLLAAGKWPRTVAEANSQSLKSWIAPDRVKLLAPDEHEIYLLPPPFHTVREKSKSNWFWSDWRADPEGIDFDLAIDIADFGPGSDAPIVLDYRENLAEPCVIRLRWSSEGDANKWVLMARNFKTFVETLFT